MPSGASTMPSIFWSRNWRARSSKRSAWRRRSRWASRRTAIRVASVAHDDQPPRLHQPDRRRAVRGLEHAAAGRRRDRRRAGSAGCRGARRSRGGRRRARRRRSASPRGSAARSAAREASKPGGRRRADEAIGRHDASLERAVESRAVKRGGARNPVRVRDGRATVTGTTRPGSQELVRREPFRSGTPDPAEVSRCTQSRSPDPAAVAREAPAARPPCADRATRAAAFPVDEPLDERGRAAAAALAGALPSRCEVLCSPALRCRETAAAAGLDARASSRALAECDFGAWGGRTLEDVADAGRRAARG